MIPARGPLILAKVGIPRGKASGGEAGIAGPRLVNLRDSTREERDRAFEQAASALKAGALVAIPTETVYGLACSAASNETLDRMWRTVQGPGAGAEKRPALAWHLPTTARAIESLEKAGALASAHRRAITKLAPGPVTFALVADEQRLARLCESAGAVRGAFEDGREVLIRIPAQSTAQAVLGRADAPVVVAALRHGSALARTAREAAGALRASGQAERIDSILDDGIPAMGKPSTLVRLKPDGSVDVAREGALEERYIRKRLERVILFVCSGNTCRSPMAAAIARHLLGSGDAAAGGAAPAHTRIGSSGTFADERGTTTPESVEALRALGVELRPHPSRPLTREQISEAEVIYAMTRSHADSVLAMDPSAADRVMLIDPDGKDVVDPIGQGPRVYEQTARHLLETVRRRLAELDGRAPGEM